MITKELLEYVRSSLLNGADKEKLKQNLLLAGWGDVDIDEAYRSVDPKPVVAPIVAPPAVSSFKPEIKNTTIPDGAYKMEPKIIVEDENPTTPATPVVSATPAHLRTRLIIYVIVFILFAVGGYFGIKTFYPDLLGGAKSNNAEKIIVPALDEPADIEVPADTSFGDVPPVPVTEVPPLDETLPANDVETLDTSKSMLQAGSIKLIYPLNNEELNAGSKLTVKYELTAFVKVGAISIAGETCLHSISEKKVGAYSFDCILPKKVSTLKISIFEMIYSPALDSKSVSGDIKIIAPKNLTVKDIKFYPESIFVMASPSDRQDGYISFSVVYSDGSKAEVDASEFIISIADTSVVSIFGKPNGAIVSLNGKKVGKTQMNLSYKGVKKVIPIEVFPNDDTIQ
ncbi:MAG: hypothetical protein KBC17_02735 [Candidatus Pacebacteria bacterium]|nr:hypothetical protein [Candidatus Paceibacterota bacterium]